MDRRPSITEVGDLGEERAARTARPTATFATGQIPPVATQRGFGVAVGGFAGHRTSRVAPVWSSVAPSLPASCDSGQMRCQDS